MVGPDGYRIYPSEAATRRWAEAALIAARAVAADPEARARNLRHGGTWFVGVDALPNEADGAVGGVALAGAFRQDVPPFAGWHRAQVSIVYPGYPGRDPQDSEAAHRFRRQRGAAHVDGLLPVGPARRRFALEYHAFILGLPLTACDAAPTLVWPGSHRIIGAALLDALGDAPLDQVDVTEAYVTARAEVFARIRPVPMRVPPGGAFVLHRFLLHGTAPWAGCDPDLDAAMDLDAARLVAFFRPEVADLQQWRVRDWA